MRAPAPTFEFDYRHNSRKHQHRCRCCWKVIEEGERVLMVRLNKSTWALHVTPTNCAAKLHSPEGGWTWRDAFEAWGTEHLRRCGWKIPEHPMAQAGAQKNHNGNLKED